MGREEEEGEVVEERVGENGWEGMEEGGVGRRMSRAGQGGGRGRVEGRAGWRARFPLDSRVEFHEILAHFKASVDPATTSSTLEVSNGEIIAAQSGMVAWAGSEGLCC